MNLCDNCKREPVPFVAGYEDDKEITVYWFIPDSNGDVTGLMSDLSFKFSLSDDLNYSGNKVCLRCVDIG